MDPTHAKLLQILASIFTLLAKHLQPQQRYAAEAIRAVESGDPIRIAASLNGTGFWRGSGSIADLELPGAYRNGVRVSRNPELELFSPNCWTRCARSDLPPRRREAIIDRAWTLDGRLVRRIGVEESPPCSIPSC
jgi:hypothetical protein